MKVGSIAISNSKGQIVIPKKIRDALAIHDGSTLQITLVGKGLYLYPVEQVITAAETESSYLALLAKTKGAWGDADTIAIDDMVTKVTSAKHKLELQASKARKAAW